MFFIVLDLRLTKDWLSGIDSLFLCPYHSIHPISLNFTLTTFQPTKIFLSPICAFFFMHDHYRYEIIFSTFASAKRKQNRIRQKKHEEYITRRTYHPLPPLEQKSLRCICQHRAVCHHRLPAQKRGRQFSLQTESCWNCRTCRMQGRECLEG